MADNIRKQLQIVNIIDPVFCLIPYCRFASKAIVQMKNGICREMFHCRRGDCDNWKRITTNEQPESIVKDI